jgi:hypothetical protein
MKGMRKISREAREQKRMNRAEQVDRDGYAIVPAVVDELVVEICSNSSVEAICRGAEREFGTG